MFGAGALTIAAACLAIAGASGGGAALATGRIPVTVALATVPVGCVAYVAGCETHRVIAAARVEPSTTDAASLLAVAAAAPITRWLAVAGEIGVVVASALVGLLAALLWSEHAVPIYCGSFVGMVSPGVFSSLATVAVAGLFAGGVFVAAERVFDGFGGKLGTTAFVGCGATALATGASPVASSGVSSPPVAAWLVAVGGSAAVATFVVSVRLDRGPVVASALVGLAVGLLAPPLAPVGERVAAVAFCGSFVGMGSPDRLPGEAAALAGGLLAGGVFVGAAPYLAGFGGKLGTVAFVACLAVAAFRAAGERLSVAPPLPSE